MDRLVREMAQERHQDGVVSFQYAQDRLAQDGPVLVDVRPQPEFLAGHIAGAISMPEAEIESRLSDLPASREIIVYCRGEYSLLSDAAVQKLREHGFDARRLEKGFPEWKSAGLPVV